MNKTDLHISITLIGIVVFVLFVFPVFAYCGVWVAITNQNAESAKNLPQTEETSSFERGVFESFEYSSMVASVTITKCTDHTSEQIIVPETIDNKTVTTLDQSSFYQLTQVKEILLPSQLFAIENGAFYRCYQLERIILPASVEHLGPNPFFRCSSLREIIVAEGNKTFHSQDGILYNKDMTALIAYPEGKLNSVYMVPKTVTALSSSAFGYKPQVKEIYLHENVTDGLDQMRLPFPHEVTFYVKSGSAAEQFAVANPSIQYKLY